MPRDLTLMGDCPHCRNLRRVPVATVPPRLRLRPLAEVAALLACEGCGARPIRVDLVWNQREAASDRPEMRRLTLVRVATTPGG